MAHRVKGANAAGGSGPPTVRPPPGHAGGLAGLTVLNGPPGRRALRSLASTAGLASARKLGGKSTDPPVTEHS
jgi:hypothetical protein